MRLPVIRGLIRRRLLVNFRVEAAAMQRFLPAPFRPKLQRGYAIAGICLIRLEQVRPAQMPAIFGLSSENAAHRVAVLWDEPGGQTREGVFIPRRDTSLWINHVAGGRLFPGKQHLADFAVEDDGSHIVMDIHGRDGNLTVRVKGMESDSFPQNSCFESLAESSAFFEKGGVGFSVTRDCCRLDGIRLETETWAVRPLAIEEAESSFFSDRTVFPEDSVCFDHALIMRDLQHEWHTVPDLVLETQDRAEHDVSASQ